MLDWFGLRFAPAEDAARGWTLEVRLDVTPGQQAHLSAFLAHSRR